MSETLASIRKSMADHDTLGAMREATKQLANGIKEQTKLNRKGEQVDRLDNAHCILAYLIYLQEATYTLIEEIGLPE